MLRITTNRTVVSYRRVAASAVQGADQHKRLPWATVSIDRLSESRSGVKTDIVCAGQGTAEGLVDTSGVVV
jgi:hypothetical protein